MQGLGKSLTAVFLAYFIFLLLKLEDESFTHLLTISLYVLGLLLGVQRVAWFNE